MNGEYLTPKIIYSAHVSNDTNSDKKLKFGLAYKPFKERNTNHTRVVRHGNYKNSTKLTKYIWWLKHSCISFPMKYSVASKVHGNTKPIICQLCLTQKLWIIEFISNKDYFNKKSQLINNWVLSCSTKISLLFPLSNHDQFHSTVMQVIQNCERHHAEIYFWVSE